MSVDEDGSGVVLHISPWGGLLCQACAGDGFDFSSSRPFLHRGLFVGKDLVALWPERILSPSVHTCLSLPLLPERMS